ncbi:hypothetical protein [Deinococcus sp. QL22]|uniref:hypothetical protein n=1 Tax=Deinococcus sp. QL22 TaxID=2939437 RepID=UPI002017A265|nr:hypothetical protein [Deinococcus sp. QL22]UQN05481.1 hypothetical protein M1R55_11405 [Deinococcus sp. QL22]
MSERQKTGSSTVQHIPTVIYLPEGMAEPVEGSIVQIHGYEGKYQTGKTFLDEDGERCTRVTLMD